MQTIITKNNGDKILSPTFFGIFKSYTHKTKLLTAMARKKIHIKNYTMKILIFF